ncbi:protein lin-54 homolog [Drosophila tropicalis]|uniref:protein lin-54 homolog n=1 Tax=Drosophila tropicalis TaxID=46794 RepID=UPI0035AB9E6F
MEKAAPSGTGKRSAKGQAQQPTIKGCSCKRSQCIKNYCDCYQSMSICSKYCRCIDCRNTQERKNVTPQPKATAAKRDRGAILTAKAAAAAAKAAKAGTSQATKGSGRSVITRVVPQPAPLSRKTSSATALMPSKGSEQSSAKAQQEPKVGVNEESSSNATLKASAPPGEAKPTTQGPGTTKKETTTKKRKEAAGSRVFSPAVNAALFECMFVQAIEAEQMGLNEVHIGHLVINELTRAINMIVEDSCLE